MHSSSALYRTANASRTGFAIFGGPLLIGTLFDATGNNLLTFRVFAIVYAVGALALVGVSRLRYREIARVRTISSCLDENSSRNM